MRFTGADWSVPPVRAHAESYALLCEHLVDPFDLIGKIFQFLCQAHLSPSGELACQIAQPSRFLLQRSNGILPAQTDRGPNIGFLGPIFIIIFYHAGLID